LQSFKEETSSYYDSEVDQSNDQESADDKDGAEEFQFRHPKDHTI